MHRIEAGQSASIAGWSSRPSQLDLDRMSHQSRGMEPLTIDRTHILVLNYNGRGWLEECLPSDPWRPPGGRRSPAS